MTITGRRPGKIRPLRCTLCGREVLRGEEYWACNGHLACGDCFPDLARRGLAPCREVRGREARP